MTEDRIHERISANWQAVCRDVDDACLACGRQRTEVTVIGVSKYVDLEATRALVEAGCTHLGESRPQSLWQKAESLDAERELQWHLIGHLQTNKVRRLLKYRPLIQSVDSARLLDCIADESISQGLTTSVLLELNISSEASKTGLAPEAAEQLIEQLPRPGIAVLGLMAMAGWGTDSSEARRQFERTRQLRDDWRSRYGVELAELSMGMSGDYREAIAAGATMVRIGSRLFEGVLEEDGSCN